MRLNNNERENVMLLTATPEPETTSFPAFLTEVMQRGQSVRSQKHYALDHGVDEAALSRYASGAVSVYERQEIQNVLIRCDWARNYVIDLVKNQRRKRSAA